MGPLFWIKRYLLAAVPLFAILAVPFRRSPEAAKGWLLFGFFLPWPALVLYLLRIRDGGLAPTPMRRRG